MNQGHETTTTKSRDLCDVLTSLLAAENQGLVRHVAQTWCSMSIGDGPRQIWLRHSNHRIRIFIRAKLGADVLADLRGRLPPQIRHKLAVRPTIKEGTWSENTPYELVLDETEDVYAAVAMLAHIMDQGFCEG